MRVRTMSSGRVDLSVPQIIGLVAAAIVFGSAIGGIRFDSLDFTSFYESALAWRTQTPPPVSDTGPPPNLNPPTLSILFAPLTFLPLRTALIVWSAVGLIALVASLRAIHDRCPLTRHQWTWVAIACIGMMPFVMVWACGQLT